MVAGPKDQSRPLKPRTKGTQTPRHIPTEKDAQTLELLTAVGLSLRAIATEIGVGHDTLERWVTKYPALERALHVGRLKRQKRAYSCYFQQAFPVDSSGRPTGKGDTTLMIFWMKTRERWKPPAKEVTVTGVEDAPKIVWGKKEKK